MVSGWRTRPVSTAASAFSMLACFRVGNGLDGFQVHLHIGREPGHLGCDLGPMPESRAIMPRAGASGAALGLVIGVGAVALEQAARVMLQAKANLPSLVDPVADSPKYQNLAAIPSNIASGR